ncbi:MAG TPA: beta-galactosidase small subunit, partial [Spirochaetia bacterium]|nr:beta-galactosidase small subunit [Spirochaetia bacterium]
RKTETVASKLPRLNVRRKIREWMIEGNDFRCIFDSLRGTFTALEYRGVPLLASSPELTVYRAPTDNDRNIKSQWNAHGFDRLTTHTYQVETLRESNGLLTIVWRLSLGCAALKPVLRADATWTIVGTGDILFSVKAHVREGLPFLPRFGLLLAMPAGFEDVEYFGYGPHESYIDKRQSTWKSRFSSSVDAMYQAYLRPQEHGSHYSTEWASVTGGSGLGLLFVGQENFSFNASHYTQHDLADARHPHELKPRKETFIHLDAMMSGMGSNSCGPELLPQYRLSRTEIDFRVRIRPFARGESTIRELAALTPAVVAHAQA